MFKNENYELKKLRLKYHRKIGNAISGMVGGVVTVAGGLMEFLSPGSGGWPLIAVGGILMVESAIWRIGDILDSQ